ncbi:YncE family protein [Mucilaginibacter dorajii]|nr:YncE family protein [Mucilaginibacter dorajii]MCS3735868.1 YVTN family beta-propeller protein [Mucilaginibacter dorajii]
MKLVNTSICLLMFGAALVMPAAVLAQQKTGFKVLASYPVKSSGGWDYITVDGAAKLVYTSHGSQVNILATTTGDSVGVFTDTKGVHGIALVKDLNKAYTSNGRANTVGVFDLKTNQLIKAIPVGTNPDAIFYDDHSKKVYAFNGRSKDATVIDVATDAVVATIPLGGKPETGVSDGKGKVFVNIEDTNEEVVIDAKTYKVINRWKLVDGDEPSGLAIDRKTNRLFIGCGGNKTMIVLNAITGTIVGKFPIGDCDGVAFDPTLKQAYSSNGEGTISVIRELSADKFVFVENIVTEPGARTIGLDETTHKLYLPTAKSIPAEPTADNPHPRPKQIPGTFHIIVVGK